MRDDVSTRALRLTIGVVGALFFFAGCDEPPPSPAPPPPEEAPERTAIDAPPGARTVYVPAYSHLSGPDQRPMLLGITLSVRNVDPSNTVTLEQVDYFDTSGHRVRRYLDAPRPLRPLETVELSVDTLDETGGSGANFLVYWQGPDGAQPLLTEAIMFGHVGTGYMSFTSRGVELARPPVLDESETEPPEANADDSAPSESGDDEDEAH